MKFINKMNIKGKGTVLLYEQENMTPEDLPKKGDIISENGITYKVRWSEYFSGLENMITHHRVGIVVSKIDNS